MAETGRHDERDSDAAAAAEAARGQFHCDICGAAMVEIHCRIVCFRCGYQRDCSDP
jgi:hypothetical protein